MLLAKDRTRQQTNSSGTPLELRSAGPHVRELRAVPARPRVPTFRYELGTWQAGNRIAVSAVFHVVALALLIAIAPLLRVTEVSQRHDKQVVTLVAPAAPQQLPKFVPRPQLPPPAVAEIQKPQLQQPKIVPPPVERPAKITPHFEPERKAPEVAKLQPPVVAGRAFPEVNKPAPMKQPERKVEVGAFGNTNGVPAKDASTNSNRPQLPTVGSFGSAIAGNSAANKPPRTVSTGGFGAATGGSPSGTSKGNGTVVSAGFGEMLGSSPAARPNHGTQPALTPVRIEYKPRPVYTEEARRLGVQGEVVLEILFEASGKLKMQRIVKGLGHGLDESAEASAEQIRFTPATRDGKPYDSTALVHIVFELAQ